MIQLEQRHVNEDVRDRYDKQLVPHLHHGTQTFTRCSLRSMLSNSFLKPYPGTV